MSVNKWIPDHWRNGCRVKAHTRANGVRVRAHWRDGSKVRGHSAAVATHPGADQPGRNRSPNPAHPRTPWPRPARANDAATPVVVPPSLNNAAMALALNRFSQYQVQPRERGQRVHAHARLTAVIYTDEHGRRGMQSGLTTAMDAVSLPARVSQITLECSIVEPDRTDQRLRIDTPVFFNADHTVTTATDHELDPERANRIVELLTSDQDEPVARTRRRNDVRRDLGHRDPEQAVRHAIADLLELAPPPDLPIAHPITIPCPGTGYAITVHPFDT